jgi:tetratricopeptide (TPR) repeat protein
MGLCLLQASRVEDSLTALRRAADLSPENPACRLFLSMALLDGDYIKEAREAYERVIALQPDNQAAYGLKILLDLREGRASDGVADLSKKGLPANPDLAARIVMAVEAAMAEKGETLC